MERVIGAEVGVRGII